MDLIQQQHDLEISMSNRGIDRYRRLAEEAAQRGEATRTKSVQTVLDTGIAMVAEAIGGFRRDAMSGKAGRRHSTVALLEGLDETELAFIVLRIVLDSMAKDSPMVATSCAIGRAVEMEARMRKLEESDGAYVRKLMSDLDSRTDHARHRRAVLSKVLRERDDKWEGWTEKERMLVGVKLIELVVQSTGLIDVVNTKVGKNSLAVLRATPRFRDWLYALDTEFSLLAPEYLPCVIPPKDWTSPTDGGYHTDALANPPRLVKTSNRAQHRALKKADLSRVYEAVNAIQKTAWQVNERVLNVMEQMVAELRPVAGLPDMDDVPLPTKPLDIDTNEEARTDWKRAAAKVYDLNRRVTGRRLGVLRNLHTAREFAHFERIYFPHQLDFRGRIYPIPQGFNPQGSDIGKSLLHFADGDPLDTPEAVNWFLRHGANSFGVDKVPFIEREQWAMDNARHIISSACDPIGYQWWADADSPWVFLAWAFEFADWTAKGCPPTFISRVPVAMDGSCNGLQHYSAMLRDPRGGSATNLIPADRPQDIYAEVAKVVMRKLREVSLARIEGRTPEGEDPEETVRKSLMAEAWIDFGITRQITKRPVMVLPYGGTQRSCLEYVRDAVEERLDKPFTDEERPKAIAFLSQLVWDSIGEVVISARLAMGWIKDAATKATKAGHPLSWTTPSGFVAVQAYPELTMARVNTFLFGERFVPALQIPSPDKLDARRQASGIAPNFVHSLDAAALVLAVLRALGMGVTSFAMIHDSYGTTAGKTALLARALRLAFVAMYEENDVLNQFAAEAIPESVRDSLHEAPHVGGLDLQQINNAAYFFA